MDLSKFQDEISEQLDIAWEHLGASSSDLDLPDLIAHADIDSDWANWKSVLAERICRNDYHPTNVEIVDLPKDVIAVRPLARLSPEDRLTYDAAVFAAASKIESAVPRGVYSSRWWKAQNRLLSPTGNWIRMQRAARRMHSKNPSLLMAYTDVTAFYESIEIDTIIEDFASLGGPPWSTEILQGFLDSFVRLSGAWGIPQGSDASGLLANLYLIPLDLEIIRRGFRHFRYSDDIYIFGNDWTSLRGALLQVNKILRHRHLNISNSKTAILQGQEIRHRFEDAEKDALSYGISTYSIGVLVGKLREYFDRTVASVPVSARDLRFVLTQLKLQVDNYAVPWLLQNFVNVPHIAREVLSYLNRFSWLDPEIENTVAEFLDDPRLEPYPFTQQHILVFLLHNPTRSRRVLDAAWKLLDDRNKDSFVREFAARYLGRNAPSGAASNLRHLFQQETNAKVKRALLVASYESGQSSDSWLQTVLISSTELQATAKYLLARPRPVPLPVIEW